LKPPLAVRVVCLDEPISDLCDLVSYSFAFVIYRYKGRVIGHRVLPVRDGMIRATRLRLEITGEMAWHVWTAAQSKAPGWTAPRCSLIFRGDRAIQYTEGDEQFEIVRAPKQLPEHSNTEWSELLHSAESDLAIVVSERDSLDADSAKELLRPFEDPMVALSFGYTVPDEIQTDWQLAFAESDLPRQRPADLKFDLKSTPPSIASRFVFEPSCAIRTSVCSQLSVTPRRMTIAQLTYNVLSAGHRVACTPSALIWRSYPLDSREAVAYAEQIGGSRRQDLLSWTGAGDLSAAARGWDWLREVRHRLRSRESRQLVSAELWGAFSWEVPPATPGQTHEAGEGGARESRFTQRYHPHP
jgi:hypothetical protein